MGGRPMLSRLRPRSLKARLLGAFLLLSVIPLSAVGVFVYRQGEVTLRHHQLDELATVAMLKSWQLTEWVTERQRDVIRPASIPFFQREVAALAGRAGTPEGPGAGRRLREILEGIRRVGEFNEMFLLDPVQGQVLLSTDPEQEGKVKDDRPYFREGLKGPAVQHVYYSLALGKAAMAFSAPVPGPGGRPAAIVVGRVDLRYLDRLMAEQVGLGTTGRTFLVNRFNYFVSASLGRGKHGWRPVFSEGVKVEVGHPAELATLASTVNQMADDLLRSQRELEAYSQSLEARVEERTQELGRKNVHLQALFETARHATLSLNLADTLPFLVKSAAELINADASSIRLFDRSGTWLEAVAHHGLGETFAQRGPVKVGEGVSGRMVLDGEPLVVEDVEQDRWIQHRAEMRIEGLRSLAMVPLRSRDRILGTLTVYARAIRCFPPDEVGLLGQFGNLAALAIGNAQLYEELKRSYEERARAQDRLVQSEKLRALGEMAGGVAHDFNNLLTPILGRAQYLLLRLAEGGWPRRRSGVASRSSSAPPWTGPRRSGGSWGSPGPRPGWARP